MLEPAHGNRIPANLRYPKVLIVDDDDDVRTLIGLILDLRSIPHEEAADGAAALERLGAEEYGAVILDLMMPITDGFGVMVALAKLNPSLLGRIVVLTAATREVQALVDKRVFGIMTKPFAPSELTDCVQRCRVASGFESASEPGC
ncbi:MAG: response regulator [Thermoanaerobaculia bacterium]